MPRSSHILKRFVDTSLLDAKFPPLVNPTPTPIRDVVEELPSSVANPTPPAVSNEWFPAKCLLAKRTLNGQIEFLVKFQTGEKSWERAENVSQLLIRKFLIKKSNESKRRQLLARQRFRE